MAPIHPSDAGVVQKPTSHLRFGNAATSRHHASRGQPSLLDGMRRRPYRSPAGARETVVALALPFDEIILSRPNADDFRVRAFRIYIGTDTTTLFDVHLQSIGLTPDDKHLLFCFLTFWKSLLSLPCRVQRIHKTPLPDASAVSLSICQKSGGRPRYAGAVTSRARNVNSRQENNG